MKFNPFSPLSVPGCVLWLDANDPNGNGSTVSSGTTLTSWVDKSGFGNTVVASGSPVMSNYNSRNAVYLNSNYFSNAKVYPVASTTIFFVLSISGPINDKAYFQIGGSPNSGGGDNTVFFSDVNVTRPGGVGAGRLYYGDGGGNQLAISFPTATAADVVPFCIQTARISSTPVVENFVNGGLNAQKTGTVTRVNQTNLTVGSVGWPWTGYFSEILMYNSTLPDSMRQTIEGYLAVKWNLQASLPATNPFQLSRTGNFKVPVQIRPVNLAVNSLSVVPAVRYSFLSTNYAGSGPVNNIGSNSAVGTASVVTNSYTSTNPGFITNVRNAQYVLGASTTFRTIIVITRIRDTTSPSYFLDGRPGMGEGWIYDNNNGTGWNGNLYYRDTVSQSLALPGGANDNQWHHHCLIAASSQTSAITFGNRFSLNEGMGADFAEIMMFPQALTQDQINNNYSFFAPSFGLSLLTPPGFNVNLFPIIRFRPYPVAVAARVRLTYSGAYTTVTVPSNASYMFVNMWGAGGAIGFDSTWYGGGGAYIEGYLPVTPGETLRFIVGAAGSRSVTGDANGSPGFGSASYGGGRTAVQRSIAAVYTDVVVAGAGGGAGGGGTGNPGGGGAATLSGIAFAGRSGNTNFLRQTANNGVAGGGGGQSSGGTGGGGNASGNGAKGQGGSSIANYSGGGGSGWYGGGGGTQNPNDHGSGGGGSSYGDLLINFIGFSGSANIAGNTSSPLWVSPAGNGSTGGAAGDGLLYYQFFASI